MERSGDPLAEVSEENKVKVDALVNDINRMTDERVAVAIADSKAEIESLKAERDAALEQGRKDGEVSFYEAVKRALGFGDF